MPAVTAAVANAFFDATGVRMTRAPSSRSACAPP